MFNLGIVKVKYVTPWQIAITFRRGAPVIFRSGFAFNEKDFWWPVL